MSLAPAPLSVNVSVANARNWNAQTGGPTATAQGKPIQTKAPSAAAAAPAAAPLSQRSSRSTTRPPPLAPGSGARGTAATQVSSRRSSARRSAASPAPPAPLPSLDAVVSSLRLLEPVSLVHTGREGVHLALRVGGGGRDPAAAAAVTRMMVELSDKFPRVYSSGDEAAMLSHCVVPLVGAMFAADGRSSSVVCQGSAGGESSTMWGDSFRTRLAPLQQADNDAGGDKENGDRNSPASEIRRGALAVALEEIFAYMCDPAQLSTHSFALGVSMVDISPTEQLSDCFAPGASAQPKLLESWAGSLTVANVTRKLLHSQSHAMRVIASAMSNPAAPGAHRVLTLSVEKRARDGSSPIVCSQMQFFDLASPITIEEEADPIASAAGGAAAPTPRRTQLANPSLSALDKVVLKLAQLARGSSHTLPSPSPATAPHSGGGGTGVSSQQHVAYRESKLTRLLKSCLGASECRNHCLFILTFDAREAAESSHVARVKFARKITRISNTMCAASVAGGDSGPLPGHAFMHDELEKGEVPLPSPSTGPRASPSSAHLHLHRSHASSPSLSVVGVSIRAKRRLFDGEAPSPLPSPALSPAPSRTPSKSPDGSRRRVQLSASRSKAVKALTEPEPVAPTPALVDSIPIDDAPAEVTLPGATDSMALPPVAASGAPQSTRRWRVSTAKPPSQPQMSQPSHPFDETHELPGELARALHLPDLRTPESAMVSIGHMPGTEVHMGRTLNFSSIPLTALPSSSSASTSASSPAPWPRAPNSTRRWMVRPSVTPSIAEVDTSNESSGGDGTAAELAALQEERIQLEKRLTSALSTVEELTSKQQQTERLIEEIKHTAADSTTATASAAAVSAASASAATAAALAAQAECDSLRAELARLQEQMSSLRVPMASLVEPSSPFGIDADFLCDGSPAHSSDADADETGVSDDDDDEEEGFDSFMCSSTLPIQQTPTGADKNAGTDTRRLSNVNESPVLDESEALDESGVASSPGGTTRTHVVYRRALRLLDRAGIDLRRVSMNDTSSSMDESMASNGHANMHVNATPAEGPVLFLSPQPASPPPPMSPPAEWGSPMRPFSLAVSPAACSRVKQLIRTGIQMQSFALHSPAAHPRHTDVGSLTPQQLRTLHVDRVRMPAALVLPSRQRAAQVAPLRDEHFAPVQMEPKQEEQTSEGHEENPEPASASTVDTAEAPTATAAEAADPLEAESHRLRACAARFQAHRKQQQQDEKMWQSAAGCSIM